MAKLGFNVTSEQLRAMKDVAAFAKSVSQGRKMSQARIDRAARNGEIVGAFAKNGLVWISDYE